MFWDRSANYGRFLQSRPPDNRKCLEQSKNNSFSIRSKTPIYIGIVKTNVGSPAHLEIFLIYILVSGFIILIFFLSPGQFWELIDHLNCFAVYLRHLQRISVPGVRTSRLEENLLRAPLLSGSFTARSTPASIHILPLLCIVYGYFHH
jgi:hypothetical protein